MSRRSARRCRRLSPPAAAAGAVLFGVDGRLPGVGPGSFAGTEVQQFRRPRRLFGQRRRRPGCRAEAGFQGEVCHAAAELIEALDANFAGHDPLAPQAGSKMAPKWATTTMRRIDLLVALFDRFAAACEAAGDNGRGGIVRPGTGSAMYYVWLATGHAGMREPVVGATADGRRAGEYFSANLAPSPGCGLRGPISVLQSFSKLDYRRICNGGPITLELSDSVFRGAESLRKVAMLVRIFAALGCQQLQLNTINVAKLQDAKRHPERHGT